MKAKIVLLASALTIIQANASITLSTQFGVAFDAIGVAVPDGTLWALVVDTNADSLFTGFGVNSSLAAANVTTPGVADSYFTAGQQLSLGSTLNGNTVFAMGGFNGTAKEGITGLWTGIVNIAYPANGTEAARNFAFYWFPGAVYANGATTIGDQVGGIQTTSNDGIFEIGMVLPSDGAIFSVGAANSDGGGSIPNSSFTAVTLVPEPSAALLGALGVLGLLRRRRI